MSTSHDENRDRVSRRRFLSGAVAAGAGARLASPAILRGLVGGAAGTGLLSGAVRAQGDPAAHRFLLGTMEIVVLTDGGLSLPASTVANNVPEEERSAFLAAAGHDTATRASALNVTLIRKDDNLVLVDTGAGMNFFQDAGRLADSFETAGIDREAVTHVVLTHGHPDHVWGIVDDFDESERFPNAQYVMGSREWDFWNAEDFLSTQPEILHSFALGAQRNLGAVADKTTRVNADHTVIPGVTMIDTPGHTPGHMSVLVEDGGGQLLVTGDALTHPAVSFERPDWQPSTDQLPEVAAATRRQLLDRAATDGLLLVGYHLPWPGVGRVETKGAAWRYVAEV
uniref:MBL fold metallo-hydrolase n=1 Tax=Stappia sp. TaxID=1870903 RepID=UPI003BA8F9E1